MMNLKIIFKYFLAAMCFFAACHVSRKAQENMSSPFDTQGHRGSRGLMPENTFPAMKTALDLGVVTLEMDVVITKDKKVVLSHEPWMGHEITTKPDGSYVNREEERSLNIYQMTYEEVQQFDVGMKPHPRFPQQRKLKLVKPLLAGLLDSIQQYMDTVARPAPYFNIETKCMPAGDGLYHPKPAEFVELLMAVVKEKGIEDRVIIQSFDFRTLRYLNQKYPGIKTAMLIEDFDRRGLEAQLADLGFTPTIYSPAYQLVNAELARKCHALGIKIIPWTVNDKSKIEELKSMGVDGLISDYPNLFK
ncbi:MAG TPA: glycerophosphodiester phosphodiesterase [Chitinophagaceae bacterium]|nr:glycerophosphodiester phosphodiesterase [Chitinophagaceae bacterium]